MRPESKLELDELAGLLQRAPTLRIQINGHTDTEGEEAFNQKLSEARAKTVHDYLLNKGIDQARLRYKGFGEHQPIEDNDTPEHRARNRRTEFETW